MIICFEARCIAKYKLSAWEAVLIKLDLVSASVVVVGVTGVDNLLDEFLNLSWIGSYRNHKIALNGGLLVSWQGSSVERGNFVHVGELAQSTEKVVGRDCGLALEETQPENLGALDFEILADFGSEVVVHDVLKVHLVQIVGPRVQHREALVVDALRPILHDVVANEAEVCLVGFNRIKQVVFVELLFVISNKRSNRFDAGGALQVL